MIFDLVDLDQGLLNGPQNLLYDRPKPQKIIKNHKK